MAPLIDENSLILTTTPLATVSAPPVRFGTARIELGTSCPHPIVDQAQSWRAALDALSTLPACQELVKG
jgi:hypothetical protein